MKWVRRLLGQNPLRGRVHRMSVTKGGEVSIVVRFGMEEMRARQLNQGALLDIVPHTAGKAAAAIQKARTQGMQLKDPEPERVVRPVMPPSRKMTEGGRVITTTGEIKIIEVGPKGTGPDAWT